MKITKKASKQMRKLPRDIQKVVAITVAPDGPFGQQLRSSNGTLVSYKLPHAYRVVLDRATREVRFVGTHEAYNQLIKRGGKF